MTIGPPAAYCCKEEIAREGVRNSCLRLGAALGQERIYVTFAERTWILDAGEHRG
jgi:hypothetical protein